MPPHEETLYVLQNKSLMEQIERSLKTHREGTGYRPSPEELENLYVMAIGGHYDS